MKNRLLLSALAASIFRAAWGAALRRLLSWSDGC